jgi:hypothetical protein
MNKKILLENDTATLYYYPDEKIIHHVFHKFIFGDKFREVLMTGADHFTKNNCKKWLSDDRKNPVLKKEDMDWGNSIWRPKVFKAGWKYWAILLPDKEAGKIAMKSVIEDYSRSGITVELFENTDDALKWLTSL